MTTSQSTSSVGPPHYPLISTVDALRSHRSQHLLWLGRVSAPSTVGAHCPDWYLLNLAPRPCVICLWGSTHACTHASAHSYTTQELFRGQRAAVSFLYLSTMWVPRTELKSPRLVTNTLFSEPFCWTLKVISTVAAETTGKPTSKCLFPESSVLSFHISNLILTIFLFSLCLSQT